MNTSLVDYLLFFWERICKLLAFPGYVIYINMYREQNQAYSAAILSGYNLFSHNL